ncbi:MAG: M20/M25/M40 family metallo-hydrolase [Peptococcaceae bacterium]|nr:M20/M25/M40 family metallo-hydrolase [Candidatus Syntrophopropionicum ammoniitolerans]
MVNAKRIVEEFFELVQIDSVSGKERRIADLLKKKLAALGLEVFEDGAGRKVGSDTGNIIAKMPGSGSGPVLMLCAHMDTVEPGSGIKPRIEGDVIRSAGDTVLGADDKAGIVTILEVLRVIREQNINHSGLEVVFTIWEEGGLFGAKNLDFSQLEARVGFVLDGDGSPGSIIVKAPSQDRIGATIRGRAAHAGINPEDGINAIQVAAHAIAQMRLGRIDHETTSNIGVITGGKATNIVPASVTLDGETRSLDSYKRETLTTAMCGLIKKTAVKFGAGVDIVTETVYEGYDLDADSPPVQLAVEAASRLGLTASREKTGGGSDANVFNCNGIETTVLGIGMKKVHTTEEYIALKDMYQNAVYLLEIVKSAQKRAR